MSPVVDRLKDKIKECEVANQPEPGKVKFAIVSLWLTDARQLLAALESAETLAEAADELENALNHDAIRAAEVKLYASLAAWRSHKEPNNA